MVRLKINSLRSGRWHDKDEILKALSKQNGIPYQNLINLYLRECAHAGKKLAINWN